MKSTYHWRFTGGIAFIYIEETLAGYTGKAQLFIDGVEHNPLPADYIYIPEVWETEDQAINDLCYVLYFQTSFLPVDNRMEYMRTISCGKDSADVTCKDLVDNPVKNLVEELEEFREILEESAAELRPVNIPDSGSQLNLFG